MAPQKVVGGSASPLLREEGESLELQEQCWQVMHQLEHMAVGPSPIKPLPTKLGVEEGKVKPLVALDPAALSPLSPNFLQVAMEQCRLRLNEQGGLVPTNS